MEEPSGAASLWPVLPVQSVASRMAWQTRQDASLLCLRSIAEWRVRRRIGVNHTCPFRGPGAAPRIGPVMVGRPKGMRLEAPAHAGQALWLGQCANRRWQARLDIAKVALGLLTPPQLKKKAGHWPAFFVMQDFRDWQL